MIIPFRSGGINLPGNLHWIRRVKQARLRGRIGSAKALFLVSEGRRARVDFFQLFYRQELDRAERPRLLDLPAGAGGESARLERMGFEVVSADLFPPAAGAAAPRWVRADCNAPLPFRSGAFDAVLSREGIEHFENQAGFVRECARVLRPGGRIVLTTPNVLHLSARLSAMLTGQRTMRRGLANEVETLRSRSGSRFYHGHIFLIDYFRLRYLMRLAGLGAIEVYTDRFSPSSIALAPVVPAMYVASRAAIAAFAHKARQHRRAVAPPKLTAEIVRHVFSPALLFGKRMIVTAVREGGSAQGAAER
jgi:2-polyprenyl-3-methyl-5-hydroxy-6-metoxy-1,4-benzoquinol methylase